MEDKDNWPKINLVERTSFSGNKQLLKQYLNKAVVAVKEVLDLTTELEGYIINVVLVSRKENKRLNIIYRKLNKVCEALTFNYQESETKEKESDIVLTIDGSTGIEPKGGGGEIRVLAKHFIHALLHVLGYNHQTEKDLNKVLNIQKEIYKKLGIR